MTIFPDESRCDQDDVAYIPPWGDWSIASVSAHEQVRILERKAEVFRRGAQLADLEFLRQCYCIDAFRVW
ncbi:hypothetical protein [Lamprocystis purpurea]|jgi:hypothetical protein|uniref:hypothetical protein n=1 Tax=Lamprocystis purpurea TaxID=61598 RepID=UPI00035FC0A7|nr:hypothetical protein [Lamprocystis purpurea]